MDTFFKQGDKLNSLLNNLKKNSKITPQGKTKKEELIAGILSNLKLIISETKNKEVKQHLKHRYLKLKGVANQCYKILKSTETPPELELTLASEEVIEEECKQEEEEEEEDSIEEEANETEEEEEEEDFAMAPKLDISLALKLVEKFNGTPERLTILFEQITLLREYSEGVSDEDVLKFLKTRLDGPAHGAINSATTIEEAKQLLKGKFQVRFSPSAIEAEMAILKQDKKTISEYGQVMSELAAKLAAAHVSKGTFPDEAAADAIVQPTAVKAFMNGLKNQTTQFFLTARNPETLTKAISDALEVTKPDEETALWLNNFTSGNNYRGRGYRGRSRGYHRGRGNYRGRGSYQNYNNGSYRGRGGYQNNNHNYRNNGNNNNNNNNNNNQERNNRGNNNRGRRQNDRHVNAAEEGAEVHEEVNVANLFRE